MTLPTAGAAPVSRAPEQQQPEELKPCPFCGSTDITLEPESTEMQCGAIVECGECSSASVGVTLPLAIERWNRRASLPLSPQLRSPRESAVDIVEETRARMGLPPLEQSVSDIKVLAILAREQQEEGS